METKTHPALTNGILLLGIDQAFRFLSAEDRVKVTEEVKAELRQMTLNDLVSVVAHYRSKLPQRAPRDTRPSRPHRRANGHAKNGKPSMHDALKEVLANGQQPIAHIADALQKRGVVEDVSPETKKMICEFLARDKTFSIRTRGVYAIRTRV